MNPAAPAAAASGSVSNPLASPKSQILSSQSALTCFHSLSLFHAARRKGGTNEEVPGLKVAMEDARRVDVLRTRVSSPPSLQRKSKP